MADGYPRKKGGSGCLKLFLIIVLLLIILIGLGCWFVTRKSPTLPMRSFNEMGRDGIVFFNVDPTDQKVADLVFAIDPQLDFRPGGDLNGIAKAVKFALDPRLIIVLQQEGDDPATSEENFGVMLQFHRFLAMFEKSLRQAAAAGSDPSVYLDGPNNDVLRIVPDQQVDEMADPALTRNSLIVSNSDKLTIRLAEGVQQQLTDYDANGSWSEPPFADPLYEDLYGRLLADSGQLRGFFPLPEGRLKKFLLAGEDADGNIWREMEPAQLDEIDRSIRAAYIRGELVSADVLEIDTTLVCRDEATAQVAEKLLREEFATRMAAENPEMKIEIQRDGAEVMVKSRMPNLVEEMKAIMEEQENSGGTMDAAEFEAMMEEIDREVDAAAQSAPTPDPSTTTNSNASP